MAIELDRNAVRPNNGYASNGFHPEGNGARRLSAEELKALAAPGVIILTEQSLTDGSAFLNHSPLKTALSLVVDEVYDQMNQSRRSGTELPSSDSVVESALVPQPPIETPTPRPGLLTRLYDNFLDTPLPKKVAAQFAASKQRDEEVEAAVTAYVQTGQLPPSTETSQEKPVEVTSEPELVFDTDQPRLKPFDRLALWYDGQFINNVRLNDELTAAFDAISNGTYTKFKEERAGIALRQQAPVPYDEALGFSHSETSPARLPKDRDIRTDDRAYKKDQARAAERQELYDLAEKEGYDVIEDIPPSYSYPTAVLLKALPHVSSRFTPRKYTGEIILQQPQEEPNEADTYRQSVAADATSYILSHTRLPHLSFRRTPKYEVAKDKTISQKDRDQMAAQRAEIASRVSERKVSRRKVIGAGLAFGAVVVAGAASDVAEDNARLLLFGDTGNTDLPRTTANMAGGLDRDHQGHDDNKDQSQENNTERRPNPLFPFSYEDGSTYAIDREKFLDFMTSKVDYGTTATLGYKYIDPEDTSQNKWVSIDLLKSNGVSGEILEPNKEFVSTEPRSYDAQPERNYLLIHCFIPNHPMTITFTRSDGVEYEDLSFTPNFRDITPSDAEPTYAEVSYANGTTADGLESATFSQILDEVKKRLSGVDVGTFLFLQSMPTNEQLPNICSQVGPALDSSIAQLPEEQIREALYSGVFGGIFERRKKLELETVGSFTDLHQSISDDVTNNERGSAQVKAEIPVGTIAATDNYSADEIVYATATTQQFRNAFAAIDHIRGRTTPFLALAENYQNPKTVFEEALKALFLNPDKLIDVFTRGNPCEYAEMDSATRIDLQELIQKSFSVLMNVSDGIPAIEAIFEYNQDLIDKINGRNIVFINLDTIKKRESVSSRTPTPRPTLSPTNTPLVSPTATATPSPTNTPPISPTNTQIPTATSTPTATPGLPLMEYCKT